MRSVCVGSSPIIVKCHSSRHSELMNSRLHSVGYLTNISIAVVGCFWRKIEMGEGVMRTQTQARAYEPTDFLDCDVK